jgi:3-keto-disaccharide hydrolase
MMIRSGRGRSACASVAATAVAFALLSFGSPSLAARAWARQGNTTSWQPLFDGKTLTNWTPTKFFREGAVKVENGQIVLEAGGDMTGVTWAGPELPTTNYEIAMQAMRVEGSDFFAGVTFPVADSYCSLIVGGWGGKVVGLSSIDGMDASENQTSQSADFESKRWYSIRIRVTPAKIETWLDDKQIINEDIKGKKIHTRFEMDPSKPFGIASWRTKAALRDLRLRRLN